MDMACFLKTCCKDRGSERKMIEYYWQEMLRAVRVIHAEGSLPDTFGWSKFAGWAWRQSGDIA